MGRCVPEEYFVKAATEVYSIPFPQIKNDTFMKWVKCFLYKLYHSHAAMLVGKSEPDEQRTQAADVNVLRSSVSHYFKYDISDMIHITGYSAFYDKAVDSLREEGWVIRLEPDSTGELFYVVYTPAIM